jgi:hypothetical protein
MIAEKSEGPTHSDPSGNQIDLVQHVDEVLVSLLLAEILDNRLAPRPKRIPRVENVDDNVRRVEDLVEFSPDSARRALGVHCLTSSRRGRVVDISKVGVVTCTRNERSAPDSGGECGNPTRTIRGELLVLGRRGLAELRDAAHAVSTIWDFLPAVLLSSSRRPIGSLLRRSRTE